MMRIRHLFERLTVEDDKIIIFLNGYQKELRDMNVDTLLQEFKITLFDGKLIIDLFTI